MNENEEFEVAAASVRQAAALAHVFYEALHDLRLPDSIIHDLIVDWHRAMIAPEVEWTDLGSDE